MSRKWGSINMKTYKLGNKVKCIIRAFTPGKIGEDTMQYKNQPYTVINEIEAQLDFQDVNKDAVSPYNQLSYNSANISEARLWRVPLTNKILGLLFPIAEESLCNTSENYDSDENGIIYLTLPTETIYQVFVIDEDGNLESAYGEYSENTLTVNNADSNYLIFYSYLSEKGFSLNKPNNLYVTLDLELIGNLEEETTNSWIHLEKCAVAVDRSLFFNRNLNTVDLTFKVIDTKQDYLSVEE